MDVPQFSQFSFNLAIFVVHEFYTNKTTKENIQKNAEDFNAFMSVIGASQGPVTDGMLYGPITVEDIDCLIGKAIYKK